MISTVSKELRAELSSASNIKSDRVRKNVQSSLNRCIQSLKQYKKLPENGLAIFASPNDITVIEPPMPMNINLYRCDNHYHTEWLQACLSSSPVVGLIAMDNSDAGIGYLIQGKLVVLKTITSGVQGKSSKGGFSQRRYERLREMHLNDWYHRIADYSRTYFLDKKEVKEIYIQSPAFTKHDFMRGEYLEYRLQKKVTRLIDGCYAGEDGLYELKNRISQ